MKLTMKKTVATALMAFILMGCSGDKGAGLVKKLTKPQPVNNAVEPIKQAQSKADKQAELVKQKTEKKATEEKAKETQNTKTETNEMGGGRSTGLMLPSYPLAPSSSSLEWRKYKSKDAGPQILLTRYKSNKHLDPITLDGKKIKYSDDEMVLVHKANQSLINGLNFEKLAKEDKQNTEFYGWHKGTIVDSNIDGFQIDNFTLDSFTKGWGDEDLFNSLSAEVSKPKKINYEFKNTPYASYGALFTNENDVRLFVAHDKQSNLSSNSDNFYKIGERNEKGVGAKIDFIDAVKGSATYKGDVLAVYRKVLHDGVSFDLEKSVLPFKDEIIINANFGTTPEESYTTAKLNSRVLGEVNFEKSKMNLNDNEISFSHSLTGKASVLQLNGNFVGPEANEAVGKIEMVDRYRGWNNRYRDKGAIAGYTGVFSAEKQPK